MKGHLIAAAMIAVALSGCATGYHDARNPILGFAGGYWDAPGPGRLIIVGFSANSFSRNEMVENFLLYRCAEVAKREGASHFVLYATLPDAVADKRSSGRTVKSTFGKPATHAYILPVAAGEPTALSSAELIARLGPLVKPGKAQEKAS